MSPSTLINYPHWHQLQLQQSALMSIRIDVNYMHQCWLSTSTSMPRATSPSTIHINIDIDFNYLHWCQSALMSTICINVNPHWHQLYVSMSIHIDVNYTLMLICIDINYMHWCQLSTSTSTILTNFDHQLSVSSESSTLTIHIFSCHSGCHWILPWYPIATTWVRWQTQQQWHEVDNSTTDLDWGCESAHFCSMERGDDNNADWGMWTSSTERKIGGTGGTSQIHFTLSSLLTTHLIPSINSPWVLKQHHKHHTDNVNYAWTHQPQQGPMWRQYTAPKATNYQQWQEPLPHHTCFKLYVDVCCVKLNGQQVASNRWMPTLEGLEIASHCCCL